jgi:iron complex transport system substrate-binding protein
LTAGGALLALAALVCSLPCADAAQRRQDDRAVGSESAKVAQRIVSLAPFITELIYAAGAGDRLVGVSAYSDYPAQAKSLPVVGDALALNLEQLLSLKPDLVIAWTSGNRAADTARIETLGIPMISVDAQALEDIPRLLRSIGAAAGSAAKAEQAARGFEQRLAGIRGRYAGRRMVSVFLEVWHRPLMTVNGSHFASHAVQVCAGRNIFADAPGLTPEVGMEEIFARDPEAIVGGGSASNRAQLLRDWQLQTGLRAVQSGHVFYIHPDIIQRPTPRILDGVEQICADLQKVRDGVKQQ